MSERTIIDCDRCGTQGATEAQTVYVTVDRKMDAAGSMDDEQKRVDLCPTCLKAELLLWLKDLNYQSTQDWVKRVREHGRAWPGKTS